MLLHLLLIRIQRYDTTTTLRILLRFTDPKQRLDLEVDGLFHTGSRDDSERGAAIIGPSSKQASEQ